MSEWNPRAGDIVCSTPFANQRGKPDPFATLFTVLRATDSTMWVRQRNGAREEVIRKSKYSGWRYEAASAETIAAVDARREWLRARPDTPGVSVQSGWNRHPLEGPDRIEVERCPADANILRARAAELIAVADWLDAEPKS